MTETITSLAIRLTSRETHFVGDRKVLLACWVTASVSVEDGIVFCLLCSIPFRISRG